MANSLTAETRRVIFLVAVALLLLSSTFRIRASTIPWHRDNDFAHYYLTATLTAEGRDPYSTNLVPLYEHYQLTPSREIERATNPPALALLTVALSYFSPMQAFQIWTALQLLALLGSILLFIDLIGLRLSVLEKVVLLIASLGPYGSFSHFKYGQGQALMALLIIVGLQLLRDGPNYRRNIGAFLWGVATSLKLFTYPLVYIVWRYYGWKAALWFMLGLLALHLPFTLLCGPESILNYFYNALPYVQFTAVKYSGNISFTSAIVYTAGIIYGSINVNRAVLSFLNFGSVMLLAWAIYYEHRENAEKAGVVTSTMVILTACCLLSPTCWPHYLPLIYGALLLLLKYSLETHRQRSFNMMVIAVYIMLGAAIGYLGKEDLPARIVSAWWGPISLSLVLAMLIYARRTTRTNID